MNGHAEEQAHEIIIVRHRGGDHDDGHHGGVWKIAFADFMTAMMCFFLVMWLINAANEQTRAAVASYFNPVKLIDRNSSRKGLVDIGDGPNSSGWDSEKPAASESKEDTDETAKDDPKEERASKAAKQKAEYSDEYLFAEPYAVLAEIAGETGKMANTSSKGDGGAQTAGPATGASGGESYRDPFAPDFWTKQIGTPIETEPSLEAPALEQQVAKTGKGDDTEPAKTAETQAVTDKAASEQIASSEAETKPAGDKLADKPVEPGAEAAVRAKEIKKAIAAAMGTGDNLGNGLEVVATDKGVTISVTDKFDFGMFEVGSALPRRELILTMDKIGKILSEQKGAITINGHTDARPFKTQAYDNWRLSTARAHSAYYMLVRAGLDEKRITEVAGFADRKLKLKDKPLDPANRRIEILL
jgi:chemotaxis protein MotB